MTEPTADLQFEHATYEQAQPGVACGMCGAPVGGEYWQWVGRAVCVRCRDRVFQLEADARSPQSFARAALMGAGTALGCGVAYAVLCAFRPHQLAIVTIGIGYVVATVVRKATSNVSGRRYQVLAVVLTYMASAMGYAPALWPFIKESPDQISLYGQLLAAPVVNAPDAPLVVLIIGFGMYEAWRRAQGIPMTVTGPYRVGAGAPAAR
jgi:hypothetical protein